jgi:hypothetical protein
MMARPIELWSDPDSPTFYHDYVVMVTFMGKRVPWHKWAVAPLSMVQTEIQASGTTYNFYDLQVYNNRFIAGTHIKSNHSWALAMDINPRENPWKKPLTTDIPQAVRDAFTRHGFKWGGTYPTPDAMHFEYLGLPVKEEPAPIHRVLQLTHPHMTGEDVKWVQRQLNAILLGPLVVDGDYGPATMEAVKRFQKHEGLVNDGILGVKTWAKLEVS